MNSGRWRESDDMRNVVLFVPCYIVLVAMSFSAAWLVAEPARPLDVPAIDARMPESAPDADAPEAVVRLVVNDLTSDEESKRPEPVKDDRATTKRQSGDIMRSVEHGVLVVRHGPVEPSNVERNEPAVVNRAKASSAPVRRRVLVCGVDSPLPCDPLSGVRGPAEGFHKDKPWAYHPISKRYTPKKDFSYTPRTDWRYTPKKNRRYEPKRDWTYRRRLGVDR